MPNALVTSPKRNPLRLEQEQNALLRSRGMPAEPDYGQALPEIPGSIDEFLKRYPSIARFLPDAGTLRSLGGLNRGEARAYGNETVVPKSRPGQQSSAGRQSSAGSMREVLREAIGAGYDDPDVEDYLNSAEGRAAAELAGGGDQGMQWSGVARMSAPHDRGGPRPMNLEGGMSRAQGGGGRTTPRFVQEQLEWAQKNGVNLTPEQIQRSVASRIRQIEYDRRLSGGKVDGQYPPDGELFGLRSWLRSFGK